MGDVYVDRTDGAIVGVYARMQREGQERLARDNAEVQAFLDASAVAIAKAEKIAEQLAVLRAKREGGEALSAAEKDLLLDLLLGVAPQ